MERESRRLERELMLLGRHSASPRGKRDGGLMDRSAYLLLTRIEVEGPMSIAQLSDAFGLDVSTLNRQTSAMLRDDLVDRVPDPDGGIARKFRITDTGRNRLHTERDRVVNGLGDLLADWAPEDVTAFTDALERFNSDIERRLGRPWPRPAAKNSPSGHA
ncbi:MarR family winged helix-turn-helix transcriptional regulator [Streptomyces sp. NPDC059479]|uniref:MarR family winged helix-turn-helix transcriptional regulator n=1 Tax=Streptomyces sp. NPDC059479 TaxID=3346848 RepID=UPI0036767A11